MISESVAAENLEFFLKNDNKNQSNEIKKYKFCKSGKIPDKGACILINKTVIDVITFTKVKYKLKDYLIHLKDKKLSIMRTIISEKDREQFFRDYIVFSLPQ